MIRSKSTRAYRTTQHDNRQARPSPLVESQPLSNLALLTSVGSTIAVPENSGGVLGENPSSTGLTLEELEAIISDEYGPLTPWTSRKLCLDYGVRDLPNPDLPGRPHLKMVAPIAEELVHDTIVRLWEKAKGKTVELNNADHVRGWLKKALKFALLQWVQSGVREYEKRVYSIKTKDEEEDPIDAEILELWDTDKKESVWHQRESVFDRAIGNYPSGPSEPEQAVSTEVNTALQLLPRGLQKLINQVYREQVSWKEAGAPLDIEGKTLALEVQRWLHTLRRYVPSYRLSKRWIRDTRRARKSFHCPLCDILFKGKARNGTVCPGCGVGIPKELVAVQYSYHA